VAQIVGPHRVVGGLSFLCSNKVGPGHIHHIDYGAVGLAEYSPEEKPRGITDRLRAIGGDFERAGIEVELIEDLILAAGRNWSGTSRTAACPWFSMRRPTN